MVLLAILISQMIPGIVVANALYSAYTDLGLLNSIPGLILADSTLGIPFAILIMRAFMLTHARGGHGGGAGRRRRADPRVRGRSCCRCRRNALITAALFVFLFAWGDFLFALTLTTTEDVRPVTLGLYTYIGTLRERLELGHGHRRAGLAPRGGAARRRPEVRRGRHDGGRCQWSW